MIANGIEDPPPCARPGDDLRTSVAAREKSDDLLFLDDDDDLVFENGGKNSTLDVQGDGANNHPRPTVSQAESDEDLMMDVDPFEVINHSIEY